MMFTTHKSRHTFYKKCAEGTWRIEGRRVGVREDAHTFYKKCAEARGDMGRNTFYKKCAEAPRSFGTECLTFSASFNIVATYGIGWPRIARMDTNRGCWSGMGVI